jgi:hypothetical protein
MGRDTYEPKEQKTGEVRPSAFGAQGSMLPGPAAAPAGSRPSKFGASNPPLE